MKLTDKMWVCVLFLISFVYLVLGGMLYAEMSNVESTGMCLSDCAKQSPFNDNSYYVNDECIKFYDEVNNVTSGGVV